MTISPYQELIDPGTSGVDKFDLTGEVPEIVDDDDTIPDHDEELTERDIVKFLARTYQIMIYITWFPQFFIHSNVIDQVGSWSIFMFLKATKTKKANNCGLSHFGGSVSFIQPTAPRMMHRPLPDDWPSHGNLGRRNSWRIVSIVATPFPQGKSQIFYEI